MSDSTELQNGVIDILASNKCLSRMSAEQKLELFGEDYYDDPKSFKFLPGEVNNMKSAIVVSKKIVDTYDSREFVVDIGEPQKKNSRASRPQVAVASSSRSHTATSSENRMAAPANALLGNESTLSGSVNCDRNQPPASTSAGQIPLAETLVPTAVIRGKKP